jgi:3-methyladenine DNA glycosylase AlkC
MAERIKDRYNLSFFEHFSQVIKSAYPTFDEESFLSFIFDHDWEEREFKQRIRHVTFALRKYLPTSYAEALQVLMNIAPQCRGVEYLFFPDFVEVYGIEKWEASMRALEEFTKYSSSEFAVRPFIIRNQDKMMEQMQRWSLHEDEHIRRLASEGCRPRLPWATALVELKKDPTPILTILEHLKNDPSLYVRKSVANNLNDISKDHPNLLKQIVREWRGKDVHTDWIVKHACRSLLKKGDRETLQIFGYTLPASVSVQNLSLSNNALYLGETLTISFEVNNESNMPQNLRIECGIDFMKANGKQARKIFHLSEKSYPVGITPLTKKQLFQNLTTRKHYGGLHGVSILVNGEEMARTEFLLKM